MPRRERRRARAAHHGEASEDRAEVLSTKDLSGDGCVDGRERSAKETLEDDQGVEQGHRHHESPVVEARHGTSVASDHPGDVVGFLDRLVDGPGSQTIADFVEGIPVLAEP